MSPSACVERNGKPRILDLFDSPNQSISYSFPVFLKSCSRMFLLGRLCGFNLTGDAWLHCDKMNDKVYCFNFTEGFKENVKSTYCEQVDIPISKNQALQILYLKHCVYNNETT